MQGIVKKLFIALVLLVGLVVSDGDVTVLTEDNFDSLTSSGEWLLEFYAPWCGHCKRLAPIYEELATKVKGQYNIAKIDCTIEKSLQTRFGIRGFPTIKFLKDGKLYDYAQARDIDSFIAYLGGGYASAPSGPVPKAGATATTAEKKSDVVVLTDSNFDTLTSKGTWYLEFYAPWCGHCKNLAPIYEEVATALKGTVHVGKIDCTANSGVCAQYDIGGYPTIYHKRENELREYDGSRNAADFKKFAETGWKTAKVLPVPEPLSGWKALLHSAIGQIENMSINIWLVVGLCIVVGVLLGVCVVAMSPSSAPPSKTIHYTPTASSSNAEITPEEVSKSD